MKTTNISVTCLCAPCGCACRYCLLQSCKKADGVAYERAKRLAGRFVPWAKEKGLSPPLFTVGYSAEYPQLAETIAFNIANGAFAASFLQCNGIAIRTPEGTDRFLAGIMSAGIEHVDTTFFGGRDYHDAFAARKGDYDFMLLFARRAAALGLLCDPTVIVTRENLAMLPELIRTLKAIPGIGTVRSFIPDHWGRGYLMEPIRITPDDYNSLPAEVKETINLRRYKTEAQWLASGPLPEFTHRSLIVTPWEDNIDLLESMSCDEIAAFIEKLDDDYYSVFPPLNELAARYGDPDNRRLYRARDLFWIWQKRYLEENGIEVYDVTDQRNCSTVRS